MNKFYSNEHSSAEVVDTTIKGAEGVLELVRVWTDSDSRKQGYATELLKVICNDADIEGRVLMLNPRAFGAGGGLENLAPWYERFGFAVIQRNPMLMARMPQIYKTKLNSMASAASESLRT
jgi:GNAT superfamily N-acetyltransferase